MFEIILSSIASVLFILLCSYLLLKQRSLTYITFFVLAIQIALIEIFGQFSLNQAYDSFDFQTVVLYLESFLPLTFIFFSIAYSRQGTDKSFSFYWWLLLLTTAIFPASVFSFPLDNFFISPDLQIEKMLFLGNIGYWFYMGVMVYCVIALTILESTFSATTGTDRWRMKFEVIGVTSILAIFIFYFSQGLLYRTINMNLLPIRSGVLIIASILIGYSKIFRGNSVKVSVSRYILYRSFTLLVVGIYLLILGLIGEGMRYFDISFSRELGIFIAFVTGIAMLFILFSEQLRRKVKVFLNKHFYAHKRDYRTEWLTFTENLTSCGTIAEVQNTILDTYKKVFGLKGASLYLLDENKKCYTSRSNRDIPGENPDFPEYGGLITYFNERGRVYNPYDEEYTATEDEKSFVRHTAAHLIVPLLKNNHVSGFIILGEQLAREKLIYEDFDLMKNLSKQALLSLANFRLSEELAETREVAAVARISSFVIHDLKNLASSLTLLLDNADEYIGNMEFQKDMIGTIRNSVNRMQDLIQRLKNIPEKQRLNTEIADIHTITRDTVHEVLNMRPGLELHCEGYCSVSRVDREEIKKVILNLILNSIDANNSKGEIKVTTGTDRDMVFVSVMDNGCGMTEEFIANHLFKPFRTTKKKGLGIGLYQCKQIIEAHGGVIEVKSKVGDGSVFTVYLNAVEDPIQTAS
jgi:putative PEP-CTERM system histidine kinase